MPSEAKTFVRSKPAAPAIKTPAQFAAKRNFKPRRSPVRSGAFDPVHPNAGIEAAYRSRLLRIIDEMNQSLLYWLRAAYRKNEPRAAGLAQDALPSTELSRVLRRLSRYWTRRINRLAPELADYFATTVAARSDRALEGMLRRGGFGVKLKWTQPMQDIMQASVAENVALIKSIAAQHLPQVETLVMRSVQTGRDLHTLTTELQKQFGVTRRRAELIARDQNNKATAVIQRARQLELGITKAVWVHSGGGRQPRPTHVKAGRDRVQYDVATGWYDPAIKRFTWPGVEINCRCVAKPVVPGFS